MPYLSQVIGKPVSDAAGEAFDTVSDLVIYHGTEKFPRLTGILLRGDRSRVAVIPWDAVAEFSASGIRRRVERRRLGPRPLQPDEILLRDDILDSQVVDPDDIKVVRVNDAELRQVGTDVRVLGADGLEEAEPEVQTAVLQELTSERASDNREEMKPDEAADVLGERAEERAEELIGRMEKDKAEEVSRLLQYEPETAAGKMTTEFIALPASMTVEQVLARLRETKPDDQSIYYLYVVDDQGRLVGVLSIRGLISSAPDCPISKLMRTDVVY